MATTFGSTSDDGGADTSLQLTDPTRVDRPVQALMHEVMKFAWRVNRSHPMAFVFDAVSPAMEFKHGMLYNELEDFPEYDPDQHTYIDTSPPGWMQFNPRPYE